MSHVQFRSWSVQIEYETNFFVQCKFAHMLEKILQDHLMNDLETQFKSHKR
jgi:hypothetical protein